MKVKAVNAHLWEQQEEEFYPEPNWCSRVLLEAEFAGSSFPIYDPCCGWGRIVREAHKLGIPASGSDMVDRGAGYPVKDFLDGMGAPRDNFVFNPPFSLGEAFVRRAVALARHKVCALLPVRRVASAKWLAELPMVQLWFLAPRPSMPPGRTVEELAISLGKEPGGGSQDFCWVVFDKRKTTRALGRPGWLHRDRGVI